MSYPLLRKTVAASLLGAALATPAVALDLFGPSCLEKLTERTRLWAECTHQFERTDNRCKKPAAKMHAYMQKCARDGASKTRVDAAMTEGYRLAGNRPAGTPTTPATTRSSGDTENLLSKYARDSRSAQ